jgi:hypothetical protein
MASVIPTPMINAKLYKNFAAITCAITVCVAVMADGEAQEALESGAVKEQRRTELQRISAERTGGIKIGVRTKAGSRGFGEEFDSSYGAGDPSGSWSSGSLDDGESVGTAAGPPSLSEAELAAMSPSERAAYDARRKALKRRQGPSAHDIAALKAAAAARAGSSEVE